MEVFHLSKTFPSEEKYSLIDQGRRSSRSVAANISEAWRKRRYPASLVSKLNDAEGEAAETKTWIQFAVECGYANAESTRAIYAEYDSIIAMLVNMQNHPEDWALTKR
jgi:four helix bundle protein